MKNLTFLLIFISITFSALAQRAYIKDKDNRNTGYFEKNNEGGYNFYSMDGSNMGRTKYENGEYIKLDKYGNAEYKIKSSELDNLYKKNAVTVDGSSNNNYITQMANTPDLKIKPMDFTALDKALEAEAIENDPDINIRKLNSVLNQYQSGDKGYVVWWDLTNNPTFAQVEDGAGRLRIIGFTKAIYASFNGKYYVILGIFQSNIEAQEWIKRCKSKLPIGGFELKVLSI